MPDLATFSAGSLWAFFQVFTRVSALFVTAPVFGSREIPTQVKAGLAAILSLVLLPPVRPRPCSAWPPCCWARR